jgi:hypothetical protein
VSGESGQLLVDAHVHLHACFDPEAGLEAAAAHFRSQARGHPFTGVLMLAEPEGSDPFAQLRAAGWRRWSLEPTGEAVSRRARREGDTLVLVGGFQVPTAEGLEVLALASSVRPTDRAPLAEVLAHTRDAGGVPVIPWGAGKWLGRRGRVLRACLDTAGPGSLFLGDNGGRPAWWRDRAWFARAERRGIHVLGGSDPLPFPGESHRIGGHGFRIPGSLSATAPAADLLQYLDAPELRPAGFGRPEPTTRFLRNQIAMQHRLRLGRH